MPHWSDATEIMPFDRARLNLDCALPSLAAVLSDYLPASLGGSYFAELAGYDPTGGKSTVFSIRADSYERLAPEPALDSVAARIRCIYGELEGWSKQIDSLVSEATKSSVDTWRALSALLDKKCTGSTGGSRRDNVFSWPDDGNGAYNWRIRHLREAKHQVLFATSYLSLDSDAFAIVRELGNCALRGVPTFVILDNFGADSYTFTGTDTRYKQPEGIVSPLNFEFMVSMMVRAGVHVCFWRPGKCVRAGTVAKDERARTIYDAKLHCKFAVFDHEIAFVTDRNVGSCYFRNPLYSCSEVWVTGSMATELTEHFCDLWRCSRRDAAQPEVKAALEMAAATGGVPARLLSSTVDTLGDGMDPILLTLLLLVERAKVSIDFEYAYMTLPVCMQQALIRAMGRGVNVRVITNSKGTNDLWWIHAASMKSLIGVAKAGAKVLLAQPQKAHVHAKLACIDREWVVLGSFNLWHRSLFYELESSVCLQDLDVGGNISEEIDELEAGEGYKRYAVEDLQEELAGEGGEAAVGEFWNL
jgi:phosphatidylserine/phosphatidylglycerophosphate/cardiolipin synthase-like enzyme